MCEDGAQRVLEGQRLCSEVCVVSVSTCEPPAQSGGCCPPRGPRVQGPCSRSEAGASTGLPPLLRLGLTCRSGPRCVVSVSSWARHASVVLSPRNGR